MIAVHVWLIKCIKFIIILHIIFNIDHIDILTSSIYNTIIQIVHIYNYLYVLYNATFCLYKFIYVDKSANFLFESWRFFYRCKISRQDNLIWLEGAIYEEI